MSTLPRTLAFTILYIGTLSAQEAKPKLELRTATGQTTFHIGERIPLTLTLTGPDNNTPRRASTHTAPSLTRPHASGKWKRFS